MFFTYIQYVFIHITCPPLSNKISLWREIPTFTHLLDKRIKKYTFQVNMKVFLHLQKKQSIQEIFLILIVLNNELFLYIFLYKLTRRISPFQTILDPYKLIGLLRIFYSPNQFCCSSSSNFLLMNLNCC